MAARAWSSAPTEQLPLALASGKGGFCGVACTKLDRSVARVRVARVMMIEVIKSFLVLSYTGQ